MEIYPGDHPGGRISSSPSPGSYFNLYIISLSSKGYSKSRKKILKHLKKEDDSSSKLERRRKKRKSFLTWRPKGR